MTAAPDFSTSSGRTSPDRPAKDQTAEQQLKEKIVQLPAQRLGCALPASFIQLRNHTDRPGLFFLSVAHAVSAAQQLSHRRQRAVARINKQYHAAQGFSSMTNAGPCGNSSDKEFAA
jgi:hypothetical protein